MTTAPDVTADPGGRALAFEDRFVFQWHITDRCNLACTHCYRTRPLADLSPGDLESILSRICDFLARQGLPGRIHFAGGEPLSSSCLAQLARQAHDAGLTSRVLTNGTLATPALAARLREAGCQNAQVSVEGSRAHHDAIRGKGAFERALEGARHLAEAGFEVTLAMTVGRGNLSSIEGLREAGRGVARRLYFSRLVAMTDAQRDQALSRAEWMDAMHRIVAISDFEVPLRDPVFRPLSLSPQRAAQARAVGGCSLGFRTLCVDANGDVYPCRRLPIVVGNLLHQAVEEILQAPLLVKLRNRDELGGKCGRCVYRWLCGGCRAVARALTGDPFAADPLCPHPDWRVHALASWLPAGRKRLRLHRPDPRR